MNLPAVNPDGYVTASISNATGFHNADFLLAHGSGDDNVHYANSAHLLDMLTAERVRGFRFRMFTDRCALCLVCCPRDIADVSGWRAAITASTSGARTGSCTSS